ncbi:MAG: hypothetical protein ACK4MF_06815 [Hyphomicrobiaceae bacterium]
MRRVVVRLCLLLFTAALLAETATAAGTATAPVCKDLALRHIQRLHPPGFAVYVEMRRKSDFLTWLQCEDLQLDLATAVHESVHMLTEELDAYPLIDGRRVARIGEDARLLPPGRVASQFDARSTYVETYLMPGAASSAQHFGYLLDELNAYTHDLATAVALRSIATPGLSASHRDGLAALMSFVAAYTQEARRAHPPTWQRLNAAPVRATVGALWSQAERVMGRSCGIADFGTEAPAFLAPVCRHDANSALGQLLGRPPACPVTCARPLSRASLASGGARMPRRFSD